MKLEDLNNLIDEAKRENPPLKRDKRTSKEARFYCHSTGELFNSWRSLADRLECTIQTAQKRLTKSPTNKDMKYVIDLEKGLYLVNGLKLERIYDDFIQPETTTEQLEFRKLLDGIKMQKIQNKYTAYGEGVTIR